MILLKSRHNESCTGNDDYALPSIVTNSLRNLFSVVQLSPSLETAFGGILRPLDQSLANHLENKPTDLQKKKKTSNKDNLAFENLINLLGRKHIVRVAPSFGFDGFAVHDSYKRQDLRGRTIECSRLIYSP